MFEFYDFLVVAVICGCLVGAYRIYMQAKYPRSFKQDEKHRRRERVEDTIMGGLVMLFIGIAVTGGVYYILGPDPWMVVGFICMAIGLGLLVAHYLSKS